MKKLLYSRRSKRHYSGHEVCLHVYEKIRDIKLLCDLIRGLYYGLCNFSDQDCYVGYVDCVGLMHFFRGV